MKLQEIIQSNHWLSVELILLQLYPDQIDAIDEYSRVFEYLKGLEPQDNSMKIVLTEHIVEYESEALTEIEVSGEETDENGNKISYALEFTRWNKWLGMDISPRTIANFTELEIIAHCLYEMTFISYNEEEIQAEFENLNITIEEIKAMTEEERLKNTISLEDLLKSLNDDESETDTED
ncbi:MAG: DUF6557 family protein [Raineya sp.]